MTKCFICREEFKSIGSHLFRCTKENGIEENLSIVKLKQLEFKHNINKEKFTELFNSGYSIKDFRDICNIDSKAAIYLQNAYDLVRSSEDKKLLQNTKYKNTSLKKYGVESPNKVISVQEKKEKTLLNKYGQNNPAKVTEFSKKAVLTKKEKYGKGSVSFLNKSPEEIALIMEAAWEGSRNRWASYTEKEKARWIGLLVENREKWWNSLDENEKLTYLSSRISYRSKLELNIENILKNLGLEFETQKWIKNKSYDFYFPKTKIILEIQGDYWHGNPQIYSKDTILRFPLKQIVKVSELWEKDKIKKDLAESYGYKVFYLWETELKNLEYEELTELLQTYAN